jgi:nitrogen fixation-related uncharacterized protein
MIELILTIVGAIVGTLIITAILWWSTDTNQH